MRDHDETLRRYLLGKLETEERSRLEERLLREEDLFEMAEAVEADLLDDYANDRLAPEEREQVAHRLASSPQGRFRLALIRGIGKIPYEGRVIDFPPVRRELSRFHRAAAMAAMLTVAVLGSWLAIQKTEPVRPPQVAEAPIPAPTPPAPTRRSVPSVPAPLPPGDVIAESTPPETPAPRPAASWVIQLALSTVRGEGEIPVENVPPGEERVELHLHLSEAERIGYTSYQAAFRGAESELRFADLEPTEIGGKWTLVLELDPKLPEGMYEVDVWGVTASGSDEHIANKALEIQRNASADAGTPN